VVLVGPQGGANVGSVCRAIANMGGASLCTVNEEFDLEQARIMSVHAQPILDARLRCASLQEAVAGCTTVVGTTARDGPYRSRTSDVRQVAAGLLAEHDHGDPRPVALVFGPEDRGLSNSEIAACHRLACIPAEESYRSLNLAQAVLLCLYELRRAGEGELPTPGSDAVDDQHPRADAGATDAAMEALEQALLQIGFLSEDNPGHIMQSLRSVFGRAGLDERELRIVRGLARQVSWFAEGGREVALAKRKQGRRLR